MLLWAMVGGLLLWNFTRLELFAGINTHYNATADVVMYYATWMGQPEVIIPSLLALMSIQSLRTRWYFVTATVCNIIPLLVQQVLKAMLQHPRPLRLYGDNRSWIHYLDTWPQLTGRNSFPSGHSEGAFSFFCFLSLLLPAKYRFFGLLFFMLALMVAYSRIYLAAHFFEDIYTGSLIGAFTTTLLFAVMNVWKPTFNAGFKG